MPARGDTTELVEAMLARRDSTAASTRSRAKSRQATTARTQSASWAPGLRRHRHGRDHDNCGDERLVFKACGNRRKTRCPACSDVYRNDARHLVMAGLAGGKGVPESVATPPMVFATLTARPSARVPRRPKTGCQRRETIGWVATDSGTPFPPARPAMTRWRASLR